MNALIVSLNRIEIVNDAAKSKNENTAFLLISLFFFCPIKARKEIYRKTTPITSISGTFHMESKTGGAIAANMEETTAFFLSKAV